MTKKGFKQYAAMAFTITDSCICPHCKTDASPAQCVSMWNVVYSNDREEIVMFDCWNCGKAIAHPKIEKNLTSRKAQNQ